MKQSRITDTITYIEPTNGPSNMTCAALVVSSSPKIVIDLNLLEEDTTAVLLDLKPDQAYATHFHFDHAQFWKDVKKHSSADFFLPAEEVTMLADNDGFLAKTFGQYGNDEIRNGFLEIANYKSFQDCKCYDDTLRIQSGSITIEAVPTPGHSPAHTSFYIPEERIMFTGDVGVGNRFGPWYGWVSCDIAAYIESLLRLKSYDADVLLTSHEGIIEKNIDVAWDECLAFFFSREAAIRKKLDNGKSAEEIAMEGIYFMNKERIREPMKTIATIWDRIMLDHHLEILKNGSLEKMFPSISAG